MTKWRARRGILTPNAAIMVPAGGGGTLTLTFRGSASRITEYPNTYTFADFNCGTPSANRRIILALNYYTIAGPFDPLSSLTVEGNAATLHRNPTPTGARDGFALASIVDAANATPDIVVNGSAFSGMNLSVWTLTGAASTYSTSGGLAWAYVGSGPLGPDITNNGKAVGLIASELTTASGSNVTFQTNVVAGGAGVNDHRPFQSEYAGSISPRMSSGDGGGGYVWAVFT